jgi:hypothetical protein
MQVCTSQAPCIVVVQLPAPGDEIEHLFGESFDLCFRPVAVNFDQIEMRQAIDQPGRRHLTNAPEIIGVDLIDIATGELPGAVRNAVEHLIVAFQVMH